MVQNGSVLAEKRQFYWGKERAHNMSELRNRAFQQRLETLDTSHITPQRLPFIHNRNRSILVLKWRKSEHFWLRKGIFTGNKTRRADNTTTRLHNTHNTTLKARSHSTHWRAKCTYNMIYTHPRSHPRSHINTQERRNTRYARLACAATSILHHFENVLTPPLGCTT